MNVEIEITLRCNRSCPQCNRYSNLFDFMPLDDTDMTLGQIDKFCSQVERGGQRLGKIALIGGEPLLHPELEQIVDMLHTRLREKRLVRELVMTTNGDNLKKVHPRALEHLRITVSWNKMGFLYSLAAPKDLGQTMRTCPVPRKCGICLNVWGYWPCGPACAISRLFDFPQYQRVELPKSLEEFGPLDRLGNWDICQLCQWAAKKPVLVRERNEPTESYQRAIEKYRASPTVPRLTRF
jgi:hypothetical protein